MARQRQILVLQVGVFLLIAILVVRYIEQSTQTCFTVSEIPRFHRNNPYDSLLLNTTNEKLYIIKSGRSSVYVNNKGAATIPPINMIDTLTVEQMQELYFRYVENIQTTCTRMIHLGKEQDGGYHICETHANIKPGSCLVYSFGIRNDFFFDDEVANNFNCKVYSFDPGDGQEDHKHSDKVTFYSIGIGGSDKTITVGKDHWKIMTFGSIKTMLGQKDRIIDIVKMDTEGAEWDSIENMLQTGDIHKINVLILELHAWVVPESLNNFRTHFSRFLKILHGLYTAGFRIYYTNMWTYCAYKDNLGNARTSCHEVHFIRV